MGRAVGAHEPGAIDGEAHRQLLDRHVMHDLVIGALQEGRVDRGERPHALGRQPGGEGHRMLLGDADIEAALGELLGELVEPGARRHGRVDGDDLLVLLGHLDQRVGEHLGVARRARRRLHLRARDDVELADAVILVGRLLGRPVAVALLGDEVHEHRPVVVGVAQVAQHRHDVVEIVAVDRPDIVEAQLLEQRAAHHHGAGHALGPLGRVADGARQLAEGLARQLAQASGTAATTAGATDRRSWRPPAARSTCRCR